jgi:O-antigen ligase
MKAYKMYEGGTIGHTAHNIYLMVPVELGIPGLALMLAAISSALLAVRRARRAGQGSVALSALEAACIGTLTSAVFFDSLWTKMFWLPWILLTWVMCNSTRSDDTSDALGPRG